MGASMSLDDGVFLFISIIDNELKDVCIYVCSGNEIKWHDWNSTSNMEGSEMLPRAKT